MPDAMNTPLGSATFRPVRPAFISRNAGNQNRSGEREERRGYLPRDHHQWSATRRSCQRRQCQLMLGSPDQSTHNIDDQNQNARNRVTPDELDAPSMEP